MPVLRLTSDLIARVDRWSARFNAARLGALADIPGNPYGAEARPFGNGLGVACKVRHPLLRGKNRIYGVCPEDVGLLDDLLHFYHRDGLSLALFVAQGQMTQALFERLTHAGLWSAGSGTVPTIVPDGRADVALPPGVLVRPSGTDEKELYLDLFQQAFDDRSERDPEYRAFQWAEDALPGGARYIAELDGQPVGMASFPVLDGIGFLGTAGVLREFRGRGIQTALIRRRLADAPCLGCDLVLVGGSPGSTTYRNFERAGLRLIPTGMSWGERAAEKETHPALCAE